MPSREQLLEVIQIQSEIARLGLDLGGVMQLVVERTIPLIGADGAAIELAEDTDMVYRAAAGIAKPQMGLHVPRDASLSGKSVQSGEALRCDDSETDPRVNREACRQVGLRSMLVIPLRHRDTAVGVLKAMARQPARFSDADVSILVLLSDVVASAMYFSAKYDSDNLFHKATHDAMTGLANRAMFMDRLRSVISQGSRDKRLTGLLMIDMDGLKQVNDTHGHRAGDAVIVEFAHRLKRSTRLSDTVARLGGDEFGVILTPIEQPGGIDMAIQRIDSEMAAPFQFEGRSYPLAASIGAASSPGDGADIDRLLEIADQRMYDVKKARRGTRSAIAG